MSTVTARLSVSETTGRDRRQVMDSSFGLPDVENFTFSSHQLERGERLTVDFERFFYCSVNRETLIRLTIGATTVEFLTKTSLLLQTAGQVELVNPLDHPVLLAVEARYVSI